MRKIILTIFIVSLCPLVTYADNVGNCGWGSKLFDGQRGIAPQVLAVTTNGTSGNQTFAISSGTSGCSQDGVVSSTWRTAAYMDSNMHQLAKDISRGDGESLNTFASLLNVQPEHVVLFNKTLKDNFSTIFETSDVASDVVLGNIKNTLDSNTHLARYSANV